MAVPLPPGRRPAALLLTGGASRRMGRDKATLEIDGQPLARRTAALLLEVADPVIEVGPGYTTLTRAQEHPPGSGPLAAVAAGSDALGPEAGDRPVLVVATDLPGLTAAFLHCLAKFEAPTEDHCVVPFDAEGRAQPLCARYSPAAMARAREMVGAGHRSMHELLGRLLVVPFAGHADTQSVLRDVDTPTDLGAFQP